MVKIFFDSNTDMWAAEHDLLGRIANFKSIRALVAHVRHISPKLAEAHQVDAAIFHEFVMSPQNI